MALWQMLELARWDLIAGGLLSFVQSLLKDAQALPGKRDLMLEPIIAEAADPIVGGAGKTDLMPRLLAFDPFMSSNFLKDQLIL